MAGLSKELLIAIAICVPLILWSFGFLVNAGADPVIIFEMMAVQVGALLVGGVIMWRSRGIIIDAVTRVWERMDLTRAWDKAESETSVSKASPDMDPGTNCPHCGSSLSATTKFCRRCGKPVGGD